MWRPANLCIASSTSEYTAGCSPLAHSPRCSVPRWPVWFPRGWPRVPTCRMPCAREQGLGWPLCAGGQVVGGGRGRADHRAAGGFGHVRAGAARFADPADRRCLACVAGARRAGGAAIGHLHARRSAHPFLRHADRAPAAGTGCGQRHGRQYDSQRRTRQPRRYLAVGQPRPVDGWLRAQQGIVGVHFLDTYDVA